MNRSFDDFAPGGSRTKVRARSAAGGPDDAVIQSITTQPSGPTITLPGCRSKWHKPRSPSSMVASNASNSSISAAASPLALPASALASFKGTEGKVAYLSDLQTGPLWLNIAKVAGLVLGMVFRFTTYKRFVFLSPERAAARSLAEGSVAEIDEDDTDAPGPPAKGQSDRSRTRISRVSS